jgi:hypothetical protein
MHDPVAWMRRRRPELLVACVVVLAVAPAFMGGGSVSTDWGGKGWWERPYFVTNALLALAAMAAVLVALYQLNASRRGQKAEVYLEFDRRWGALEGWRTLDGIQCDDAGGAVLRKRRRDGAQTSARPSQGQCKRLRGV